MNDIFKYGRVISVDDNMDGYRIKVHIRGVDASDFKTDDLPYAFPFLPKTFSTKPKIGEWVFIISQDGDYTKDRFWIGPIISQSHKIKSDTLTALSFLKSGIIAPDESPKKIKKNDGVNGEDDDTVMYGRDSTDVIAKPNEVQIRAGKTLDGKTLNTTNPAYIQTKYNKSLEESTVNVVADKINLLTHKGTQDFSLITPNSLINDETYAKILEKAHQLPYGDILVEFIKLFLTAFYNHVHPYNGMKPDLTQKELKKLIDFDLNTILSNNVRID